MTEREITIINRVLGLLFFGMMIFLIAINFFQAIEKEERFREKIIEDHFEMVATAQAGKIEIETDEIEEDSSSVGTFFAYTATESETDKNPTRTASGETVAIGTMACPDRFAFGTIITVDGIGEMRCNDRMGADHRNKDHFDVYKETREEAFAFGRRELSFTVKK